MRCVRLFLVLILLFGGAQTAFAALPSADDAVVASKTWAAEIDRKAYADSWKDASAFFQQGVSQDKWEGMVQSVREKLGALQSRVFDAVKLTKSLPGVPDGDYAIVSFRSSFANKADSTETITLILENGHWKAGGYFIR